MRQNKYKLIGLMLTVSMIFSVMPTVTFGQTNENLSILNAKFRQHPKTTSIFQGEDVPTNLLWVEFSTRLDHTADFNEESKTYLYDGKYYQLEISRPAHGPDEGEPGKTPHPSKTIIPDNGIVGVVNTDLEDSKGKHRYHGWQIGTGELFDQDTEPEYQVGDYTATLNQLKPASETPTPEELGSCPKEKNNDATVTVMQVTYRLSESDIGNGYQLKCPMEDSPSTTITELVMKDDWTTTIAPSIYNDDAREEPKKVITGWKIVGGDSVVTNDYVGDKIPADDKDGKNDNMMTFEAVLGEPKSFTYEFTKDADDSPSVLPTPAPDGTAPPASYNEIAGGEQPKEFEYDPTATIEPLRLRLVNTGNRRLSVAVGSRSNDFIVKKINMNNDAEAQKSYADGGLESTNSTFFYIPPKDMAQEKGWKNYAIVEITPRAGLSAGEHTGTIYSLNNTEGNRIQSTFEIKIDIKKKKVQIAPRDATKYYGETLDMSKIICDVYDSTGLEQLETNVSAADLGILFEGGGIDKTAPVNDGVPHKYSLSGTQSTGNYEVVLKDDCDTGVTVMKTMPKRLTVAATGIKDGEELSKSTLLGTYINPHWQGDGNTVNGKYEWEDPEEIIDVENSGMIPRRFQFTPFDTDNYEIPDPDTTHVQVSAKISTNLTVSGLIKTYDGDAKLPTFSWARGGTPNITVKYKKVEDNNTTFEDDEQFTEENGYTETPPKKVGTYKVYAKAAETSMFAEDTVTAIMIINPYVIKPVIPSSAIAKRYDGTLTANVNVDKVSFVKPKTGNDVRIKSSAFSGTYSKKDADPQYVQSVTLNINGTDALEGTDAENYTLNNEEKHINGWIYQRYIKLQLKKDITKYYGQTYSFSSNDYEQAANQPDGYGLVSDDTVDGLRAMVKAEKDGIDGASQGAPVGEYDVTASTLGVSGYNYSITKDVLGKLTVLQTEPVKLSVSSDAGVAGQKLADIKNERFKGTFENPYSHETVEGTLEWADPNETLSKNKTQYEWKFTPNDQVNYKSIRGMLDVRVEDKPVAQIESFTVPKNEVYNGKAHIATLKAQDTKATTKVEYRLRSDVELHDASDDNWTEKPPINAGTYDVRGTVYAYDNYAENVINDTMTILRATPSGADTVQASKVAKDAYLSESVLSGKFTGVNGEQLDGAFNWTKQGTSDPSNVKVDENTNYMWIFSPQDKNYNSVEGMTRVSFLTDARAAQAKIYNIPTDHDIGNYAYVNVDKENLKAGDTVQFFKDEAMKNPESEPFVIDSEMSGWTRVNIDDDALNVSGGTLYVNIKGSVTAAPIKYDPQVGFTISPPQIYVNEGATAEAKIKKNYDGYEITNVEWSSNPVSIASVEAGSNNETATVTGISNETEHYVGEADLTAVAAFKHPDPLKEGETISVTNTAKIIVSDEQPPEYTYSTLPAQDINDTGATLVGNVEITKQNDSAITPQAYCRFLIWEKDTEETTLIENGTIMTETGNYSISVSGLAPGTTYEYRAVGINGDEQSEVMSFTTTQTKYTVTFKNVGEAVVRVDDEPLGDKTTIEKNAGAAIFISIDRPPLHKALKAVYVDGEPIEAEGGTYWFNVTKNCEVSFEWSDGIVSEPDMFKVDASGTATATVTNHNDTPALISLISASYDADGHLQDVKLNSKTVAPASTENFATSALDAASGSIKAFLWDMNTYAPIEKTPAVPVSPQA